MGFSRQPASQNIEPGWVENDPAMVGKIEKNGNRGDFVMTMGRNILDETLLAEIFAKHLNGPNVHHLKVSRETANNHPINSLEILSPVGKAVLRAANFGPTGGTIICSDWGPHEVLVLPGAFSRATGGKGDQICPVLMIIFAAALH